MENTNQKNETTGTEEVKEQPTKKSNGKWWCLGVVAVAAVAGGAAYAYKKFYNNEETIVE